MQKPTPVDIEKVLEERQYIVSQTNKQGIIVGVNDYFSEISGYSPSELKKYNHNMIRHPDMPKLIFKMMWASILNGNNFIAFIKNLAKDGRYYWVLTDFEILKDKNNSKEITGFYAYRKAAPQKALIKIIELYSHLLEIEKGSNVEEAQKYLNKFLSTKNMSYDEYIESLIGKANKKSFLESVKSIF